jgi:hypothetical protein
MAIGHYHSFNHGSESYGVRGLAEADMSELYMDWLNDPQDRLNLRIPLAEAITVESRATMPIADGVELYVESWSAQLGCE